MMPPLHVSDRNVQLLSLSSDPMPSQDMSREESNEAVAMDLFRPTVEIVGLLLSAFEAFVAGFGDLCLGFGVYSRQGLRFHENTCPI